MSRRAQVENIEKEDAKAEVPELEEEKKVLEKQLDEALEKGENADNEEDAAAQNKIADSLEADLEDLNKEIEEIKAKADGKPQDLKDINKETKETNAKANDKSP